MAFATRCASAHANFVCAPLGHASSSVCASPRSFFTLGAISRLPLGFEPPTPLSSPPSPPYALLPIACRFSVAFIAARRGCSTLPASVSGGFSSLGASSSLLQKVLSSSSLAKLLTWKADMSSCPALDMPPPSMAAVWSTFSARAMMASRSTSPPPAAASAPPPVAPPPSPLTSFIWTSSPPRSLKSCSAPKRSTPWSSSLLNCALPLLPPTTVRPLASIFWMTRWSSTIFCFARSRMLSSTLFEVTRR
mmetsp:Transcript_6391/g.25816  ORF Transcript_6391/g.25816 Transcript_6391/m.25816 type:complete len:249 (-) Transcript_6391:2782-3528(-)